jgi:hypothetical protein
MSWQSAKPPSSAPPATSHSTALPLCSPPHPAPQAAAPSCRVRVRVRVRVRGQLPAALASRDVVPVPLAGIPLRYNALPARRLSRFIQRINLRAPGSVCCFVVVVVVVVVDVVVVVVVDVVVVVVVDVGVVKGGG